jgi:hypothetical protein
MKNTNNNLLTYIPINLHNGHLNVVSAGLFLLDGFINTLHQIPKEELKNDPIMESFENSPKAKQMIENLYNITPTQISQTSKTILDQLNSNYMKSLFNN